MLQAVGVASIAELSRKLCEEAASPSRFPARFLLLRGLENWSEMVKALRVFSRPVCLSDFCSDVDLLPDMAAVRHRLHDCGAQPVTLLPVSEVVRLGHFSAMPFLQLLATMELVGGRVYVPLYDLADALSEVMSRVARYGDDELPDVYEIEGSTRSEIELVGFHPACDGVPLFVGVKDYLRAWEKGAVPARLRVWTQWAGLARQGTGLTTVRAVPTPFKWLQPLLHGRVSESFGTGDQWSSLAGRLRRGDDLESYLASVLNANRFDASDLFHRWSALSSDEKWLLLLWAKIATPTGTYLSSVLASVERSAGGALASFEETIVTHAFQAAWEPEALEERRGLISSVRPIVRSDLGAALKRVSDPVSRLRLATGHSSTERIESIRSAAQLLLESVPEATWSDSLRKAYPELSFYLDPPLTNSPDVGQYFAAYNRSKVMDRPSAQLLQLVERAAEARTLLRFPPRQALLDKATDEVPETGVVWVDGMGVEWAQLLLQLVCSGAPVVGTLLVGRSSLPSITENNKGWGDSDLIVRKLDEFSHSYTYRHPESLERQIGIVASLVPIVVEELSKHPRVVVTSDHGASRFSANEVRHPLPQEHELGKWGRFTKARAVGEQLDPVPSGAYWIDGSLVLCAYGRFQGSLGGVAGEVHGGGALEESLVPVLVFDRAESSEAIVELITPEVRVSARGTASLTLKILGSASAISILFGGSRVHGTREGQTWRFDLKNATSGAHVILVEDQTGTIGRVKFRAVRGLEQEDILL